MAETAHKAADTIKADAKIATDTAADVTQITWRGARDLTAVHVPIARMTLDRAVPALQELVKARSELATTWAELLREQMEHNGRTLQKLAGVRDWPSAIAVQSDYVVDTLQRMSSGIERQIEFASIMSHTIATNGEQHQKA